MWNLALMIWWTKTNISETDECYALRPLAADTKIPLIHRRSLLYIPTWRSHINSLSVVFERLLRLIGAIFLSEPEEERPRLSGDLSQRAGQETDGAGGGSGGGRCTHRRSAWPEDITASLDTLILCPPASQGINKPIMAAAHMGSHTRDVTVTGLCCNWLAVLSSNASLCLCSGQGPCYCCRCYSTASLTLYCNGGQRERVRERWGLLELQVFIWVIFTPA